MSYRVKRFLILSTVYIFIMSIVFILFTINHYKNVYAAIDESQEFTCPNSVCGWHGRLSECKKENKISQGVGSGGLTVVYYCPNPKNVHFNSPQIIYTGVAVSADSSSGTVTVDDDAKETYVENMNNKDIMTDDKLLEKYGAIRSMVKEICAITSEEDKTNTAFDSIDNFIINISNISIEALNNWSKSSIYYLFLGCGFLITVISYVISFYHSNVNGDDKTMEQYIRLSFSLLLSCFIIFNINKLLQFMLMFFQWIMENIINFKNNSGDIYDASTGVRYDVADQITIVLLKENGLDKDGTLQYFLNAINAIGLQVKLLIPWLIAVAGKFGIIFAIANNSIQIFLYACLLPMGVGDCVENFKNSRLLKYLKHIASHLLQQSVIILTLIASQVLMKGYIDDLFAGALAESSGNNLFNIIIIMCILSLVKMVVANSSSRTIAGHVIGE